MTISAFLFTEGTTDPEQVTLDEGIVRDLGQHQLLWVDVLTDPRDRPEELRAVDDLMELDGALSGYDGGGLTSVRFAKSTISVSVPGLAVEAAASEARTVWLYVVAAPNRVVSLHSETVRRLSDPVSVVASDPRFGRLDAGTFMGLLLDGMLDGYFSEVERIEQVIDELDGRALRSDRSDPLLDELVEVRRRIASLRRALAPQREVFAALLRPVADQELSPIGWPWPGLGERLDRALVATENVREQLLGTFDIVSTRLGQRTNDVMRVLTVLSAVLLPSVVIAGAMGMNFKIPFFDDPGNFLVVTVVMVLLAIAILTLARLRRWI